MRTAILMIGGENLKLGGGAERRFCRVWEKHLNNEAMLICNTSFHRSAVEAKILKENSKVVLVSDSYFRSLLDIIIVLKKYHIRVIHFPLLQVALLPIYLLVKFVFPKIKIIQTVALSTIAHNAPTPTRTKLVFWISSILASKIDSLYASILNHNKYNVIRNKIMITPSSFTDLSMFKYEAETKEDIVLFCGRLIDEKNPLLALDAFRKFALLNPDWKMIFCGGGPLESALKDRIIEFGLSNKVSVYSSANTSSEFRKAKIFLSLQNTENYPSQSLLEALASGCNIIASNVGETQRIVKDHETGLLSPLDSTSIAIEMGTIAHDHKLSKALIHNGRELVRNHHTSHIFAEYLREIWRHET